MTIEPSALHNDYAKFAHSNMNNYTDNPFNTDFPSSQITATSISSSSEASIPSSLNSIVFYFC